MGFGVLERTDGQTDVGQRRDPAPVEQDVCRIQGCDMYASSTHFRTRAAEGDVSRRLLEELERILTYNNT